jgi:uncharacterized phage infection (PIP) family protein YhgE
LEEIVGGVDQLAEANASHKEKDEALTNDLENVNRQLINVYNQCEQLRENNKQLLSEKQALNSITVDGLLIECLIRYAGIVDRFR